MADLLKSSRAAIRVAIAQEPNGVANKWDTLVSDTGVEIPAKSGSFFPLNPHCYIDLLRRGEKKLLSSEIWPTSRCNHHCTFCSSCLYGLKGNIELEWLVMRRLINDIADMGNMVVRFSGGGEPTLYKKLGKAIELVAERNMFSCLITNGSVLSEELIDLITEHSALLRFSFNGADARTYHRVHGVDDFDNVVENMSLAVEARNQKGRRNKMLLGATFVITKDNFTTISRAASLVKETGFDFFMIRGHNPVKQLFKAENRKILDREISASHLLASRDFFVSGKLSSLDGTKPDKSLSPACYATHFRTYVDFRGQVSPCFKAICSGCNACGDVTQASIGDIWGKGRHLQTRESLKKGIRIDCCRNNSCHCGYTDFNNTMWEVEQAATANPNVLFKKGASPWAKRFMPKQDWF